MKIVVIGGLLAALTALPVEGQSSALEELEALKVESECDCEDRCKRGQRVDYQRKRHYEKRYDARDVRCALWKRDGVLGRWEPSGTLPFSSCEVRGRRLQNDHVVSLAEAHDSGGCRWSVDRRAKFGVYMPNLTLTTKESHSGKQEGDAADHVAQAGQSKSRRWSPPCHSARWYAETVVAVKKNWNLTVDKDEKKALKQMLGIVCPPRLELESPTGIP